MEDNNYRNGIQDKRLDKVEKHIETTNKEMGDIKIEVEGVRKDVGWLKKFFFIIATSSIGSLIATLFNLLGE